MTCDNCNNNESGQLTVTRGNDFTQQITVTHPVVKSTEDFDLSTCTGVSVTLVSRLGKRTAAEYEILDGNKIQVKYPSTLASGLYGFEMSGKTADGTAWRFYAKPGEWIRIVEPTSDSNVPDGCDCQPYYDNGVTMGVVTVAAETLDRLNAAVDGSAAAVKEGIAQGTAEQNAVLQTAIDRANEAVDKVEKVIKENITISVSCNHDETLTGKKVYVRNSSDKTILDTLEWQGETLKYSIAPDQGYYVELEAMDGYTTPTSEKYTAISGNVREIQLKYESEWFYPTLQMEDGTDCDGTNCALLDRTTWVRTAMVYKKGMCLKIPMGHVYQLVPVTKSGYYSGIFVSRKATEDEYSVTATYKAAQSVIGIQMLDGTVVSADDWDDTKYSTENVNGIIVCATGVQCVIYPDSTKTINGWGIGGNVNDCDLQTSESDIKGQLGEANTEAIVKAGAASSTAAGYCHNTVMKSGKRCYLPAYDELQGIFNNKTAIAACVSKIGIGLSFNQWIASSTQCSASGYWAINSVNGQYTKSGKTSNNIIFIPVSAL